MYSLAKTYNIGVGTVYQYKRKHMPNHVKEPNFTVDYHKMKKVGELIESGARMTKVAADMKIGVGTVHRYYTTYKVAKLLKEVL